MTSKKRIDLHVHLAGMGGGEAGCFVSPKMRRSLTFIALKRALKIDTRDEAAATRTFAKRIADAIDGSTELDYAAVFAMDGVYDGAGELLPADSHMYVPNSWVFEVCKQSPKLLPVISVNPMRKDAIEELHRWGENAIALKWLGPLQKFDASEARHDRFHDAVKELGLPIIAHSGCEHTFPNMAQRLGDPKLYEGIAKRGIPIVFSHCGTGSFMHPGHDYSAEFEEMLARYDNVYGDTSAFCSLVRRNQVKRFAASRYIHKIFHGSDWPIPSTSIVFLPDLGFNRVFGLEKDRHPLDRDVRTKRAMGVPEEVFTGAWDLFGPRILRWEAVRDGLTAPNTVQ